MLITDLSILLSYVYNCSYDIRLSMNQMLQWITINKWHWQLRTGQIHTSCHDEQKLVCWRWCVV